MRLPLLGLLIASFTLACGGDLGSSSASKIQGDDASGGLDGPGDSGDGKGKPGDGNTGSGNGNTGGSGSGGGTTGNGGSGNTGNGGSGNTGNGGNTGSGGGNPGQPGVIGHNGISAWNALSAGQRATVRSHQSFFLHQSVGEDLEAGAEANGFSCEYATSNDTNLAAGMNGGLFSSSNGNPAGKIAEFRAMALANAGSLRVAIMKFGYADIVDGKLATAQSHYLAAVNDIKNAGVRVLHVTPPLVYNVPVENAAKMRTRAWMLATFPNDVIFDLQDAESVDPSSGGRCQRGGSWEICQSVRSTSGCPSQSQGVDSASGQGHICFNPHAPRIAKAFLFALQQAVQ